MEQGPCTMTWTEYHAVDAVSSTRLRWMARSPAFCKLNMDQPPEPTAPMRLGKIVHQLILEPDFNIRVSQHDGRTRQGKEDRAVAAQDGLELLTEHEWTAAVAMAESLRTNPRVAALLDRAEALEQSVLWTMKGRECKARRDAVGDGWILEIKTTSNLDRFPWQSGSLGYPIQAAWYRMANEESGIKSALSFFFAVVCSTAPYESAVFLLEDAWQEGKRKALTLFEKYLRCEKSGLWPGHVENLLTLSVRAEDEKGEDWR